MTKVKDSFDKMEEENESVREKLLVANLRVEVLENDN